MIPRQQFIEELKIREKELIEELKAIKVILGNDVPDIPVGNGQPEKVTTTSGTPKGKMSWETYVELMLKEIGGEGKSQEVAKAIVKANPKIDEARIRSEEHTSELQ